ncbi:hypothetical protein [Chitinophaga varians]|uniref:hypothetical protein n=1 Tax=Chitinophaga varians TaxID=2202339 RepID=UPI00165EF468|nr:hypothetical protein [Chitinophaga varians]MBC9914387.1 hypothetical protein [Chitinophaga varians]
MKEPAVIESSWSRDVYWANKLVSWILLLVPPVVVSVFSIFDNAGDDFLFPVLILTGVCILFVFSRFTTVLSVEGDRIKVIYVQYFRRRQRYFDIAGTVVEVRKYDGMMGKNMRESPPHYWLQIVQQGDLKWHLDSRRGFLLEEMLRFVQVFATARSGS